MATRSRLTAASPSAEPVASTPAAVETWPPEGLPQPVLERLTQPLDQALIAQRDGPRGSVLPYIEGFQTINQANRVFGFGNWGAEVVGPIQYREVGRTAGDGERPALGVYSATVRVQVRGCLPKSDVGTGFASEATPEEHDTAVKAAVTDGLKRALRHFGEQFGNSLYDRTNSGRTSAARELTDLRATIFSLGAQLGLDEANTRRQVSRRARRPFNSIPSADLACILRAMAEALVKRQRAA